MLRSCLTTSLLLHVAQPLLGPPPLRAPFPPFVFPDPINESFALGSWSGTCALGSLSWPNLPGSSPARFHVIPELVSNAEASALLERVRSMPLDDDPDSVDDAPTFEVYLERSGSFAGIRAIGGKPDARDDVFAARGAARSELAAITVPVVASRILPFVNARYGDACGVTGCVVCHSLIRKYVDGERMAHPTHFDVQALVTVVVSLSPASAFSGGLYVSVGSGTEQTLALRQGDAVVHQSNLLHGVRVGRGERWSWILWFKNGASAELCDAVNMTAWDVPAASRGDPVAAFLVARRTENPAARVHWLRAAAEADFSRAQNELGQMLREGARGVRRNATAARALLERAAGAGEPEAIYNLGLLLAADGDEVRALSLFHAAAIAGVPQAAFNVGVSFYSGRGGIGKDLAMAAQWFDYAGGASALTLSAQIAAALGWNDVDERLTRAAAAGSKEASALLRERGSGKVEL